MEEVKRIIDKATVPLVVDIPDEYRDKKVEVIVRPLQEENGGQKKYDFSKFFGKLEWKGDAVAEQRKLRDEWE
jgi:hypothetical protein